MMIQFLDFLKLIDQCKNSCLLKLDEVDHSDVVKQIMRLIVLDNLMIFGD